MKVPTLERGAVVWAALDPTEGHEQAGHRPVVLISDTRFNVRSGTAIAMPLTSQEPRAGYPFSFEVGFSGVPAAAVRSFVKPGQVRTLSTKRLGKLLGTLSTVEPCLDAFLQICGRAPTVLAQTLGALVTASENAAASAKLTVDLADARAEVKALRELIEDLDCRHPEARTGRPCACCVEIARAARQVGQ